MNENISENKQLNDLNQTISRHLDEQVAQIDASTSQRLRAARRHAIQQQAPGEQRGPLHFSNSLRTSFATAFAMVFAVFLWQADFSSDAVKVADIDNITTLENAPVLSASDDLEFFSSIDFLVWMENSSG